MRRRPVPPLSHRAGLLRSHLPRNGPRLSNAGKVLRTPISILRGLTRHRRRAFLTKRQRTGGDRRRIHFRTNHLGPLITYIRLHSFLLIRPMTRSLLPRRRNLPMRPHVIRKVHMKIIGIRRHRERPTPTSHKIIRGLQLINHTTRAHSIQAILLMIPMHPPFIRHQRDRRHLRLISITRTRLIGLLRTGRHGFQRHRIVVLHRPSTIKTRARVPLRFEQRRAHRPNHLMTTLPPRRRRGLIIHRLLRRRQRRRDRRPLTRAVVGRLDIALRIRHNHRPSSIINRPIPQERQTRVLHGEIRLQRGLQLRRQTRVTRTCHIPLLNRTTP